MWTEKIINFANSLFARGVVLIDPVTGDPYSAAGGGGGGGSGADGAIREIASDGVLIPSPPPGGVTMAYNANSKPETETCVYLANTYVKTYAYDASGRLTTSDPQWVLQ